MACFFLRFRNGLDDQIGQTLEWDDEIRVLLAQLCTNLPQVHKLMVSGDMNTQRPNMFLVLFAKYRTHACLPLFIQGMCGSRCCATHDVQRPQNTT